MKANLKRLTTEQAIVISGYTGIICLHFDKFHKDVEQRMNRHVWTREFSDPDFWVKLQELYKQDFMEIIGN